MPFLPLDQSNYAGEPVLLYEFRRGGTSLYYANADRDIQTSNGTFIATAMQNDGVKQTGETANDIFKITAPYALEIGEWYRYTPPSDLVYVIVRKFHYGDAEAVVSFIGTVVSVATEDLGQITINCQAISVSLKRTGLRLAWQRGCPHALYDQNCRADRNSFRIVRTIFQVLGKSIQLNGGLPTGAQWAGGYLEFQISGDTYERRLISSVAAGGLVYPLGQMDKYLPGMSLYLYPGCLHTSSWCDTFFNNKLNYGGFEYMPNRNPYDGDPIF